MTEATTRLRAVGLEYLDAAAHSYEYDALLAAPPAAVFTAISADPSTWTWFPGLDGGEYEGDATPGIGTRRWVRTGGVKYRETILAWDEPRRWAYRVDETTAPLFAVLLEDWVVEPAGAGSTLRWTFAFEPLPATEELFAGARDMIGAAFHDAAKGLDAALR